MKTRNLLFSALLVATVSMTVTAADSKSQSQEQTYRESLETYYKEHSARQKDTQIRTIVLVVFTAGMVVFGLMPALRVSKETLEIGKQQQKTLEEIRDLLKKHDT